MVDESLALLAERMARGSRTIAFVGAGASVRAGYPTWRTLVNALRSRAYGPLAADDADLDLRAAAELYAEVLNDRGALEEEVKAALLAGKIKSGLDFHRKLARLPFQHYITTNYDELIEDAVNAELADVEAAKRGYPSDFELNPRDRCRALNGRTTKDFNAFLAGLAQDDPRRSVLHLHGILDQQMTLTMGQYDDQYLSDAMQLRMFSIFATTTVVFIGASLYDPDVMELVRRSNYHGARRPRHFAFLPDSREREEQMFKRTYGIRPIFYDEADDHVDLDHKLDHLLELCDRARTLGDDHPDPCTGLTRTFWDPIIETQPQSDIRALRAGEPPHADITGLVEAMEDLIRRTARGAVTFSGLNAATASATMRHVARRYRELPAGSSFNDIIWLSPLRLGVFPPGPHRAARKMRDVVFGALTAKLGAARLTATLDRKINLHALGSALEEQRGGRSERRRALIVVEDAQTLVDWHSAVATGEDKALDPIAELAAALPDGSRVVHRHERAEDGEQPAPGEIEGHREFPRADQLREPPSEVVERVCSGEALGPDGAQILAALVVSADPLDEADLAAMLDPSEPNGQTLSALPEIASRCGDLCDAGLALRDPRLGTGKCAYTVAAPVRNAVLESDTATPAIESAVAAMLRWAETVMSNTRKWEVDPDQFERLTARLPVLVSIFEAGCWLGLAEREPAEDDPHSVDRLLWLGRGVSRLLYTSGRWPEALEIAEYSTEFTSGLDDGGVLDREVKLLVATIVAHGDADEDRHAQAKQLVQAVKREAEAAIAAGWEQRQDAFPPARITPERQLARAQLRLAQYLSEQEEHAKARTLLDDVFTAYKAKVEDGGRIDEDLQILGDAAGWLAESMLRELPEDIADDETDQSRELLGVMDEGRKRFTQLGNRRRLGLHASLRGSVMVRSRNYLAARRHYLEALLVATEFSDRFLEGLAQLGLARCDDNWHLADQAVRVFDELRAQAEEERAEVLRRSLDRESSEPLPRTPDIVLFIGASASGKGLARDVALTALGDWGYQARVVRIDPAVNTALRHGDELPAADVRAALVQALEGAAPGPRDVVLADASLWRMSDIVPLAEERDLLTRMLVVSLVAPRNVLLRRNEQRFSGQLAPEVLEAVDDELGRPTVPDGYLTWGSWFEERGAAYAEIPTGHANGALDVPVVRLRRTIRQQIERSFVTPECVLRSHDLGLLPPCSSATD